MTVHGWMGLPEIEWCRWVAYERWLNDKPLLSVADPPKSWSEPEIV